MSCLWSIVLHLRWLLIFLQNLYQRIVSSNWETCLVCLSAKDFWLRGGVLIIIFYFYWLRSHIQNVRYYPAMLPLSYSEEVVAIVTLKEVCQSITSQRIVRLTPLVYLTEISSVSLVFYLNGACVRSINIQVLLSDFYCHHQLIYYQVMGPAHAVLMLMVSQLTSARSRYVTPRVIAAYVTAWLCCMATAVLWCNKPCSNTVYNCFKKTSVVICNED